MNFEKQVFIAILQGLMAAGIHTSSLSPDEVANLAVEYTTAAVEAMRPSGDKK